MKNFKILLGGGLILFLIQYTTDTKLRQRIRTEYDTLAPAYLYEADSAQYYETIHILDSISNAEKGEGND